MSDEAQKTPEQVIEEGGKALEDALLSELNAAEGDDTTAASPQVEGKPKSDDSTSSPDDSAKTDDDGEGTQTEPKDKGTRRRSKSVEKLLSQRNSAREELEAERAKREEVERKLAERVEQPKAEEETQATEEDDDIESLVKKTVDERLSKTETERQKADLDKEERDELVEKYAPTAEELKELDSIIRENPNLSDAAALRIVNPSYFAEGAIDTSDARKQDAGAPTRASLRKDFDPKKLSTDDMESYLQTEIKEGRLEL